MEPGLATTAYYAAPNLLPPDDEDRVASSAAHAFLVDVAVIEIDRATGEVHGRRLRNCARRRRLLNPLIAGGQVRGGFAHGVGAALFERTVYDEEGTCSQGLHGLSLPHRPGPSAAHHGSSRTPSPFTPLGAKGLGDGNSISAPAALANAVADAIGRDDVAPPLTPPRIWDLLQTTR